MIDLSIDEKQLQNTVQRCREREILIPTFEQLKQPHTIPEEIKNELKDIGLWEVHSRNLFRINWHNEPVPSGGGFGGVNYMVLPPELTGVDAKIVALVGKWFPTGSHKVGATFGCLVPQLVTGQFDPVTQKSVWPSTGNYCRGGAYDAALLACDSIAILPEEMSKERFEWLSKIAGEVIPTPGCESNVKEIFDKCWELRAERGDDIVIFNQFEEFGNHLWHYEVTGHAMNEVLEALMQQDEQYSGLVLSSGSAGTLGSGDYLKELYPASRIAVAEALQCPTLLRNGYGGHRIEGIGDKHVPWIHNVRNTDMVIGVDDEHTIRLMRMFNEEPGQNYLVDQGVDDHFIEQLNLLGISSIGNLLAAVKYANYYELTEDDIVLTVFTDSMELYDSRIRELQETQGKYTPEQAIRDFELIQNITTDNIEELIFQEKKRIHNLKYYTWIEQQQKDLDELNNQWYNYREFWGNIHAITPKIDELIMEFNERVKHS